MGLLPEKDKAPGSLCARTPLSTTRKTEENSHKKHKKTQKGSEKSHARENGVSALPFCVFSCFLWLFLLSFWHLGMSVLTAAGCSALLRAHVSGCILSETC